MNKFPYAVFAALFIAVNVIAKNDPYSVNSVERNCDRQTAPFSFKENKGQITDQDNKIRTDIQFQLATPKGLDIYIGCGVIHYQFKKSASASSPSSTLNTDSKSIDPVLTHFYRMDVTLLGANINAKVVTEQKEDYYERYYLPTTGLSGDVAHLYNKITYKDIYPNIDWVMYSCNGSFKHEFVVNSGGKVSDIKIRYSGATQLSIDESGGLVATTPMGTIYEEAPYAIQSDGKKVNTAFKLAGDLVYYDVAEYIGGLVIDPVISWGTYYGGTDEDRIIGATVDNEQKVYICGLSSSSGMATAGAFASTLPVTGGGLLIKFSPFGTRLWATYYYRGAACLDVTTDDSMNVYMTGQVSDTSNHGTPGAYQVDVAGSLDAFLVKFDSTGARQWSTLYGGIDSEVPLTVTYDHFRGVYISGNTSSTTGIASPGAWKTTIVNPSYEDAFLAKFTVGGMRLWATYYGNSDRENSSVNATDIYGNVYLGGTTQSVTGIASTGAHQTTNGGGSDAYLVKFDSTGARQWATYYGGACFDDANSLRADIYGNIYLVGYTCSTTGIATTGSYQSTFAGAYDGMVGKFSGAGVLLWGTYYGGSGVDNLINMQFDTRRNMYIVGSTQSASGIATAGAHLGTYSGAYDAYFAILDSSGTVRQYGTYYGGSADDIVQGSAIDGVGGALYISGYTKSASGISTAGAFQPVHGDIVANDGFVVKFSNPALTVDSVANNLSNIKIFPNPSTEKLVLAMDNNIYTSLSVINCLGQIMFTHTIVGPETILDIQSLPQGVYYVKCVGVTNSVAGTFIKI